MNSSEFENQAEEIFNSVEDQVENSGADIDCENAGGILTFTCEQNGSQIIVSKQPATCEIWVAAKSGGFHLSFQEGRWFCRVTAENLGELLQRVFQEQSGVEITFEL